MADGDRGHVQRVGRARIDRCARVPPGHTDAPRDRGQDRDRVGGGDDPRAWTRRHGLRRRSQRSASAGPWLAAARLLVGHGHADGAAPRPAAWAGVRTRLPDARLGSRAWLARRAAAAGCSCSCHPPVAMVLGEVLQRFVGSCDRAHAQGQRQPSAHETRSERKGAHHHAHWCMTRLRGPASPAPTSWWVTSTPGRASSGTSHGGARIGSVARDKRDGDRRRGP